MSPADHLLQHSFGAAAVEYAEHRPDYAEAALRWALEPAPGRRVLDLGAGTGKLTATLVALGEDVVAVEPDPAMLRQLRRALPTVPAHSGSAEAIPLPDASVDAIVAGNALHWFDMDVAGPEMARVLAPGEDAAAIGPRDTLSSWRAVTEGAHLPRSGRTARFGSPEQAEFPHGQRRTADSLVATLATRAGVLVMSGNELEFTLGRIRAFLAGRSETAHGDFVLPMLTGVLRTRRL